MNKKYCPISWFRETFWPIYGRENIKFLALLLMMSTSVFAYTILRILKDTYILSAPLSSANSISFVKAYFVLPCSVIYMFFFCYLTNKVSKQQVFFVSVLPLIIFFSLFYLVLFPNISFFHMSVENVKSYQDTYPALKNFIPVVGYWVFSLFYVFAELVGTVVITFLFWGFSNYCVTPKEAVRFYPLLASYSYFSFMISSAIQGGIYKMASRYPVRSKEYFDILFINFYLIVGSLLLFLAIYYFINHYILPVDSPELVNNFKMKSKHKPSFMASMRTVMQSKYLMYIVILIVCYGITTNLIEVTWKELIRKEFNGVESAIGAYMSRFYFMTGIVTVCLGLINKGLLTRFGWGVSTSTVPLCLMFTSFLFFCLIVFGSYIPSWLLFGCSTSYIAMQVGFFQDNLAKGFRYGVLDPNMQMVYLPLDDELKLKGKASVDIIGSRLGKSIGSFLESSLSMIFKGADQIALAPIFMPVVMLSCGLWFASILFLSAAYSDLLKNKELEENTLKK